MKGQHNVTIYTNLSIIGNGNMCRFFYSGDWRWRLWENPFFTLVRK